MADYYSVLGLKQGATREEILRAYRKKALEFHPDVNRSEDASTRFKEINSAFRALTDPGFRPYSPPPPPRRKKPVRRDIWGDPVAEDVWLDSMAGQYRDGEVRRSRSIKRAPVVEREKEVDLWRGVGDRDERFWKEYNTLKRTMAYESSEEFWEALQKKVGGEDV
jgi:hypothetical protein